MWEKIKLSKSYAKALQQIDSELIYFPNFIIHKCKQRLTKITQYLIRMRRLSLKTKPRLIGVSRSVEKRQEKREAKAEIAAKLTTSIEKELLDRMRRGVYGSDGIANESEKAFAKALDTIEDDMEEEANFEQEDEEEEEDLLDREFVSDLSESDSEIEALHHRLPTASSSNEDDDSDDGDALVKKFKKKRTRVEVEYEQEVEVNVPVGATWDDDEDDGSDNETQTSMPAAASAAGKWDDEDAEEKVPDAWDADEAEESSASTPKPPAALPKQKKKATLTQKIAERRKIDEKREETLAAQALEDSKLENETPAERKARTQSQVEEADLANVIDLFGTSSMDHGNNVSHESPLDASPSTKADFDTYLKHLVNKTTSFESSPQYTYFVESLVRHVCIALNVEDTRKIGTLITALTSEKQKMASASTGGKKKKKAGLSMAKDRGTDVTDYGGKDLYSGQYDDFM